MQLGIPAVAPVRPFAEQIHPIRANVPPKLRAPHAVALLRFIQKHLAVQALKLIQGVHIENKLPARGDEQMQPLKGPLHIGGRGEVVEAVQAADGGVHGAVQVQPGHGLVQKDGRDTLHAAAFHHGGGQHLLGGVCADHLVAPAGEQPGHGAGAAGKIQHRVYRDAAAGKELFQIVRPLFIRHIPGEGVVGPGQALVCVHSSPLSFIFSRMLS